MVFEDFNKSINVKPAFEEVKNVVFMLNGIARVGLMGLQGCFSKGVGILWGKMFSIW